MSILKSLFRPNEISAIVKLKFGKKSQSCDNLGQIIKSNDDLKYCFDTLDLVSRSFAAVIRQLPSELSVSICLFYLILRGLDSIEDDMNCPNDQKLKLLREFHTYNYKNGWTLHNVGDKEEYRNLLANYDKVIRAFSILDKKYQNIITDICFRMGNGMADFAESEIATVKDYNLYCHYVAGLVGIGLSDIFSASEFEHESLKNEEKLSNSMGLFLQKTNIIRDYKEDLEETRTFWPKEIWNKYASELDSFSKNPVSKASLSCLNDLVNDALAHIIDCLAYLKKIKNNGVFKFCAIPQVMAIATLNEVYNNPKVFLKNVKIRKGFAAKLILNTNSYFDVLSIFENVILDIETKIPNTESGKQTSDLIKQIQMYLKSEFVSERRTLKIA